jgi:polyferredoxin
LNAPVQNPASSVARLVTIKFIHTVVWAFFVACILAIWVFALRGEYFYAALSIGVVLMEVLVLVLNGWRCPLTSIAAGYTDDRRDNFDIYLPEWLARHNKVIFGTLYLGGIAATLAKWSNASI